MSWDDYVRGKTIAVVGPAPAPYDQSDEVNAHDIVYRTSYGFVLEGETESFQSGLLPAGYGDRVDASFYNGSATRLVSSGHLDEVYADLDWAVHKWPPDYVSPLTNVRACRHPRLRGSDVHGNQVTLMLYDLTAYEPASVTVFGADFYMAPPAEWYSTEYGSEKMVLTNDVTAWESDYTESIGANFHDQEVQRQVIRAIRDQYGWPAGDQRFLDALYTPKEVHEKLLLDLRAAYLKTQATV